MRIGIVGGGIAGPVAALLLARDGHDVTVLERVADPRPVGAGFLLQPFGQDILDELGVLAPVLPRSMPVRRIDGRTVGGRVVLDFGYSGRFGLGVHRAVLFEGLWSGLRSSGIPVETGFPVESLGFEPSGVVHGAQPARADHSISSSSRTAHGPTCGERSGWRRRTSDIRTPPCGRSCRIRKVSQATSSRRPTTTRA